DACGTDRALERQTRQHHGSGRADQRRDVRVDVRVQRDDRGDDLHVVVETIREQRPQRAIDETRSERLFFRRAAFALEEAAGNTAGCVGLFDVVDRQREEVTAGYGLL